MTQEKKLLLHRIFKIILSIVLIAAGLCLIIACIQIYLSGDEPYSRTSVAAAFSQISFVIYLCFALVLIGFLLDLILPLSPNKPKIRKQRNLILSRLYSTADTEQCDPNLLQKIHAQKRLRYINKVVAALLWGIGVLVFAIYLLSDDRFSLADINGSVIHAVMMLMLSTAIPFGYSILNAYWSDRSKDREIALLKELPRREASETAFPVKSRNLLILRSVILTLSVALLLYGFFTGGAADVLVKAINICTECVGLG